MNVRRPPLVLAWDLVRPVWKYPLVAFLSNLACALFEGGTIGLLVAALHVLGGSPEGSSISALGPLGQKLESLRLTIGREPLFLGLVFFAVAAQVLRSLLQFTGQWATAYLQAHVQAEAYHRIFGRIMRLPFSRVSSYRLGDLTNYLAQASQLNEFFSQLNLLARSILLVAMYGLLLLWISWPMSLVAGLAYWLVSGLLHRIIKQVDSNASRLMASNVALNQRATEFLQATRLIHTFARQEESLRTVSHMAKQGLASNRRAIVWGSTIEPIMDILNVAGAAAFLIGGYLALGQKGMATLPSLLAFLLALYRVTPRLGTAHNSLAAMANLAPSVSRILEILSEKEDPDDAQTGPSFPGLRDSMEFREVTLRYHPGEPAAVEGLSFQIPKGSFTALVGASGAGKSTVADLLLRLFEPTSGSIWVDGIPVNHFRRSSWREHFGVVSQEPFLFHASIRENIAFGRPTATMEEIMAAAKEAHAHEFITRLASGYETEIGDRGYRLSGGQRQRIALARALLRQPEILVLDEAMSAIDSESEHFIQQALDEQRGTRTVIGIAHRLSTITGADQILVLAQGRLVEQGTHQELLAKNRVYARLWQLQSEDPGEAPVPLLDAKVFHSS